MPDSGQKSTWVDAEYFRVFTISCIPSRFQTEITADCSEIPRIGGVRGGLAGDLRLVLVSNLDVDDANSNSGDAVKYGRIS